MLLLAGAICRNHITTVVGFHSRRLAFKSMAAKRMHGGEEPHEKKLQTSSASGLDFPFSSEEGTTFSSETKAVTPAVLFACRAALIRSPCASRAALTKYRASISDS